MGSIRVNWEFVNQVALRVCWTDYDYEHDYDYETMRFIIVIIILIQLVNAIMTHQIKI